MITYTHTPPPPGALEVCKKHLVIWNELYDVVAMEYMGECNPDSYVWEWDQQGNYGRYQGQVDAGTYFVGAVLGIPVKPLEGNPGDTEFMIVGGPRGWHGCGHGHADDHNPHCQ